MKHVKHWQDPAYALIGAWLIAATALVGCNTLPITNASDAPVFPISGRALSQDQVRGAIIRAGAALGWQMQDEGLNLLVGTLQRGPQVVIVEIPYSARFYSVRYRSSVNVDQNYAGSIQNLIRGINAQLSAA